jgi:hypothetical protein
MPGRIPISSEYTSTPERSNTPRWVPGYDPETQPSALQSQAANAYDYGPPVDQRPGFSPSLPIQPNIQHSTSNVGSAAPNFTPFVRVAVQHNPTSPNELSTQFGQFLQSHQTHQPSQHVRVTRTRQTSQGNIPFTYNTPAIIRSDLQDVSEHEQKLYASMCARLKWEGAIQLINPRLQAKPKTEKIFQPGKSKLLHV